jgi:hypothetical protein
MKATFNIKTRILNVSGKEIYSFRQRLKVNDCGDFWHSVMSKKTGKPIYDINLWHDSFVPSDNANVEWNNPKNWKIQKVSLLKQEGSKYLVTGNDWEVIPLKVKRK